MKILEFIVGVKKGSGCKVLKKRFFFFVTLISEWQNLALIWRSNQISLASKAIFSTLPGKLHIVAEMVSNYWSECGSLPKDRDSSEWCPLVMLFTVYYSYYSKHVIIMDCVSTCE